MSDFLSMVYASLNKVVLTRQDNGLFQPQSALPDWFVYLTGSSEAGEYDLVSNFNYLTAFIYDAEEHWRTTQTGPLRSDTWIETDSLGREVSLEATVLLVDQQQVMVIERLGEKFDHEVAMLQRIRDGLLTREMLESEVKLRTQQIRQREEEIAIKLISLTSYRDEETGAHVRRIGLYAAAIARALGWKESTIDDIRIAAPMHDLGKVGIPDRILLKAGALNDDEFSDMKRHTIIGAQMLEGTGIPVLDMAAKIARHHHERWDGTGYPSGLKGEEIPLEARITAVVDIYDALVHKRVYKDAMVEEEALSIMQDVAGTHLDPDLLQLFMHLLPEMRRIRMEVTEATDESGVLVN